MTEPLTPEALDKLMLSVLAIEKMERDTDTEGLQWTNGVVKRLLETIAAMQWPAAGVHLGEKAIAEPSPLEFPDHTHRWEERSQEALDWEYHETGAQLARWYCPGCHEETDVEPDSLIAAGVHLGDEGLDAAWARAEAALPEHLDERSLSVWWDNRKPAGWWAACTHRFDPLRPIPLIVKGYPTKEAALNALAERLTEGDSR